MLKKVGREEDGTGARCSFAEASFPAPFHEGLEYSSPARGTWNIVHTGMLIPQAHEIFVCAQGCLRGVVLSAAEAKDMGRYSSVVIKEDNVLDGSIETLMTEGVADVLRKLKYRPRAVLLFISCQHFFLAYDQDYVFRTLRERFPDIKFADCYMIPTLRKSGLTPDQKMRIQMYSMIEEREKDPKKINFIGSNHMLKDSCELLSFLRENGFELQALQWCRDFDEYLAMGEASYNIYYEPLVSEAAKDMKERLGQKPLYLPMVFDFDELEENYRRLAGLLGISRIPDFSEKRKEAELALIKLKELIGDTAVAVDYTFTFRILSFVKMLLQHGFRVTEVYVDVMLPEEEAQFRWIQEHYPQIQIVATNRPKMRFLKREREEKVLAVGQKAAYFAGTDHFVNVAESGGLFGFDGVIQIAELMEDAFLHEKDRKSIIQKKGYGCESCL